MSRPTLVLLPALLLALPACAQPRVDCTAGHGGFAARYTLKAGSKQGEGDCDRKRGEIIGLEKYNPATSAGAETQDLTRAVLAIQTATLGDLANAIEGAGLAVDRGAIVSRGDFASTTPDAQDVCAVSSLSPAALAAPEIGMERATTVGYAWSNVRLGVTSAYAGTRMVADLRFSQDGCAAEYSVLGLWPAVSCEALDAEGNGLGVPDAALCDPDANPAAGRPTGSGINPDFRDVIACDPELLLCVLTEVPEELR